MTKIEAIIRPERLEEVKGALEDQGIIGITVSEVQGSGRQRGYTHSYRGNEYRVSLISKVKIEIVVEDGRVEHAIEAIGGAARTGEVGDGKLFVIPVQEVVRIRTGDRGEPALS